MWLQNVQTEDSDLDIDGEEVCVTIQGDELVITPADGGDELGTADMVLLDEPVFSDGGIVYGTVEGVDLDAEIEWNLMARMFGNDMCNLRLTEGEQETFQVAETVRMNQYDYQEGDFVQDALTACVTPDGAGVALPDKNAVEA